MHPPPSSQKGHQTHNHVHLTSHYLPADREGLPPASNVNASALQVNVSEMTRDDLSSAVLDMHSQLHQKANDCSKEQFERAFVDAAFQAIGECQTRENLQRSLCPLQNAFQQY